METLKAWLQRYSLPLFSGILLSFSFPNIFHTDFFGPGPYIAWFCLVPLFISLESESPGGALKKGYVAGLFFFLFSTAWINNVEPMGPGAAPAWLSLSAYLALYPAAFSWLLIQGRRRGWGHEYLWVPALWTLLEFAREVLVTGYPWLSLGSSQSSGFWLFLAALTGVYGLHAVVVLSNLLIYALWKDRRKAVSALVALLFLAALRFAAPGADATGPGIKVAVIQGNVDQDQAWTRAYIDEMMQVYGGLSREAADAGAKVIFWPECSFPGFFNEGKPEALRLKAFAKERRLSLILGTNLEEGGGERYYNAAVHIDASGNTSDYRKRHLVPFGEYIPLSGFIPMLNGIMRRFGYAGISPGKYEQPQFNAGEISVAPLICFESIFGGMTRNSAQGAGLIGVVTLDSWFGISAAPAIHFSHSVLRSVETGRWVARAAATGISGFADPAGTMHGLIPLGQKGFSVKEIPLKVNETRYLRFGPWFLWLCVAIIGFCVLMRSKST